MNKLSLISFFLLSSNIIFADFIQYSGVSYIAQNSAVEDSFPNTLKIEKHLRKTIFNHLLENIPQNSSLKLDVSESFEDSW